MFKTLNTPVRIHRKTLDRAIKQLADFSKNDSFLVYIKKGVRLTNLFIRNYHLQARMTVLDNDIDKLNADLLNFQLETGVQVGNLMIINKSDT